MNNIFVALTAAVAVSLATSLAAAQASAIVLAPEVRTTLHRPVVTPQVTVIAPLRVQVVHPRRRAGVTVIHR